MSEKQKPNNSGATKSGPGLTSDGYEVMDRHDLIYSRHLMMPSHNQTTPLYPECENSHYASAGLPKQGGDHLVSTQLVAHDDAMSDCNALNLQHAHFGHNLRQFQNQQVYPVVETDSTQRNFGLKNLVKPSTSIVDQDLIDEDLVVFRGKREKSAKAQHKKKTKNELSPRSINKDNKNNKRWGLHTISSSYTEKPPMEAILESSENMHVIKYPNQMELENMKMWPPYMSGMSESPSNTYKKITENGKYLSYEYGFKNYGEKADDDMNICNNHQNLNNNRNQSMLSTYGHLNATPALSSAGQFLDYHQMSQQAQYQQAPFPNINYLSEAYNDQDGISNSAIINSTPEIPPMRQRRTQSSKVHNHELKSSQFPESFENMIKSKGINGASSNRLMMNQNSGNNVAKQYYSCTNVNNYRNEDEDEDEDEDDGDDGDDDGNNVVEIRKNDNYMGNICYSSEADNRMTSSISHLQGKIPRGDAVYSDFRGKQLYFHKRDSESNDAFHKSTQDDGATSYHNGMIRKEVSKTLQENISFEELEPHKRNRRRAIEDEETDINKNVLASQIDLTGSETEQTNSPQTDSINKAKIKNEPKTIKANSAFDMPQQSNNHQEKFNACNWQNSSKKVLSSFIKLVSSDQMFNEYDEQNPLLIYLFEKQKHVLGEFPQSALEYLKKDSDTIKTRDQSLTDTLSSSNASNRPKDLMLELIKAGKLPRKPILLISFEENLSIATFQGDSVYSLYTANTRTGQVVKVLCRTRCKCCYFSSMEDWEASLMKNKNFDVDLQKYQRNIWERVLIQVPLMKGRVKDVYVLSDIRRGKKSNCAFLPLSEYIRVSKFTKCFLDENVQLHKLKRDESVDKNMHNSNTDKTSYTKVSGSSNIEKNVREYTDTVILDANDKSQRLQKKKSLNENEQLDSHKKSEYKVDFNNDSKSSKGKKMISKIKAKSSESGSGSTSQNLLSSDTLSRSNISDVQNFIRNPAIQYSLKKQILFYISSRQNLRSRISREYPNAPLGEIWMSSKTHLPGIDSGDSLLGRKWVWDEGYYADSEKTVGTKKRHSIECETPSTCRAYCNCGVHGDKEEKTEGGRTRRSTGNSVKLGHVLTELASGKLNPHTLVSCESYNLGPELDQFPKNIDTRTDLLARLVREKGGPSKIQPFSVRVSPDTAFLADLHAHLAKCEVIGLLGGRWVPEEKCVYIQAAFPCKAADSGSTDVEMDPVSQVMARDSIAAHGMKVVGWYHSHPTFQPDPSVTDIENQGNYQRLFSSANNDESSTENSQEGSIPFVGLIIGTWDGRNPSSRSVMRWFHVTPKETGNLMSIKNQSSGGNVNVDFSLSGKTAKERVLFPMQLKVTHRRFRWEENENKRKELTCSGTKYRLKRKMLLLDVLRDEKRGELEMWKNIRPPINGKKKTNPKSSVSPPFCQVISPNINSENTLTAYSHSTVDKNKQNLSPSYSKISQSKGKRKELDTSENPVILQIPPDPIKAFHYGASLTRSSFNVLHESKINLQKNTEQCSDSKLYLQEAEGQVKEILLVAGFKNKTANVETELPIKKGKDAYNKNGKNRNVAASPLPFSFEEFKILNSTERVDDEEIARIIWKAVEREQCLRSNVNDEKHKSKSKSSWINRHIRPRPASSNSILELLVQNHWFALTNSDVDPWSDDEAGEIDSNLRSKGNVAQTRMSRNATKRRRNPKYANDDITLIHGIDALLSHYASNGKRVDIMDTWNCSGGSGSSYGLNGGTGGVASGNNMKIRKGHKICVTLLRWTRNMQLSGFEHDSFIPNSERNDIDSKPENEGVVDTQIDDINKEAGLFTSVRNYRDDIICFPKWSNENSNEFLTYVDENGTFFRTKKKEFEFNRQSAPIKFTVEVMRLLAARWRETNGPETGEIRPKRKRGRPRKMRKTDASSEAKKGNNI